MSLERAAETNEEKNLKNERMQFQSPQKELQKKKNKETLEDKRLQKICPQKEMQKQKKKERLEKKSFNFKFI